MQSASAAIRALPAPDDDLLLPGPSTTLFTRHLPAQHPILDAVLAEGMRLADYRRLTAELDASLAALADWRHWHEVEFTAANGVIEPGAARCYIADLANAVRAINGVMRPEASAVPKPSAAFPYDGRVAR